MRTCYRSLGKHAPKAFALVVTLSLMVLLTIIAVSLLSLSAITLRSASQARAQSEAQSNARLALMIALGELQKQLGPDQRISANGSIVSQTDVANPHWTGVWDSWVAGDPSVAPVNPSYPSSASHQQTIGNPSDPKSMRPQYNEKGKHFRSWLLSLNPLENSAITSVQALTLGGSTKPGTNDTAVRLVGRGSLDSDDPAGYVSARLISIKPVAGGTRAGRNGWWIGDESQKARVLSDSYNRETSLSLADKIARTQAPASTGTRVIPDLEGITPDQEAKLGTLPSLASLDLVIQNPAKRPARKNFHTITTYSEAVLSDVREGGLKRDLSTILERQIDPNEVYELQPLSGTEAAFKRATSIKTDGGAFMLYSFDDMVQSSNGKTGEASVPLQDLAAYYQLYDHSRPGWKGGIQFNTNQSSPPNSILAGGIMVSNPDYGGTANDHEKYLRQHGALYRSVYPVKIEFVLSYLTELRTVSEMDADRALGNSNPDTHKLRIGFTPAMTFWNPNNVPVVMNLGNPQFSSIRMRETPMPMQITFRKHNSAGGPVVASNTLQFNKLTNTEQGELYTLYISGNEKLVFEPGESKVLALRTSSNTNPAAGPASVDFMNRGAGINEDFFPEMELVPGWNPERFVRPAASRFKTASRTGPLSILTFKPSDSISSVVNTGTGRDFNVDFTQQSRDKRNNPGTMYHYRSYEIYGRIFPGGNPNFTVFTPYRNALTAAGFPPVGNAIVNTSPPASGIIIPERSGQTLVNAMQSPNNFFDDLPQAFFYYAMKAATETHERSNNTPATGFGSGRRFPSRPFTHSTVMMPQFIDNITGPSLYNTGWNWFFTPLDNLLDAPISISLNNHGYYGGGYTAENGTTHVIQQELPVAPPISIAALSHSHLSGYSLSSESAAAGFSDLPGRTSSPQTSESYRRTTALGFGGLEPRTLQAIGNSYAHPFIPKDRAITTLGRVFFQNTGTPTPIPEPYADHSYLANKALWDEYFFSSITPVPANNPVFSSSPKSSGDIANAFFFGNEPLPNRRMVPRTQNLDQADLSSLISQYTLFNNGFADVIAAHMMVEGPFNINSTSEAAWKTMFSSLKGKSVSYLDPKDSVSGALLTKQHVTDGVPVGAGSMLNAKPHTGSSSDPSDIDQWTGWRELTDGEINQLAKAMVKQVKLRGPFLSMSEFVNRRLDATNTELSLMGALQAAIDDPDCTINEGFRDSIRRFSASERTFANAVFPEAMQGPVAYGSAAYVDQADILRNLAEQLTPRGDTFVIRAYGDSIDSNGKVASRAWCEAVVQRTPDYVDPSDKPHLKQADLTSVTNRKFGRKFNIIQFRWLSPSEI